MRRGFLSAASVLGFVSACVFWGADRFVSDPSSGLVGDLAQIGATLLIAYTVETSGLIKALHIRGGDHENWVGFVGGLGICGLLGIAFALMLSGHSGDLGTVEEIGFVWAACSIGILGVLVASMPFLIYEWTHAVHTEYPDE
jgi:drug/metabolite transporter (DMT)-like permease